MSSEETEFLTASQAAERLGTSLTNVARWCREGVLLAKKLGVGNAWQISVEALDGFTPPPRGPKPAKDRKRLLELAQEVLRAHPDLLIPCTLKAKDDHSKFSILSVALARKAGCNRTRARQALAKAIRMARKP